MQQTPQYRWVDFLISIAGAVIALVAFIWDTSADRPYSAVGLVFALAVFVSWLRMVWSHKRPVLLYYPFFALLIALLSILPMLGASRWFELIGFQSPIVAILAVFGFLGCIIGLISHFQLLNWLRTVREAS